jgi:hypothetical protein
MNAKRAKRTPTPKQPRAARSPGKPQAPTGSRKSPRTTAAERIKRLGEEAFPDDQQVRVYSVILSGDDEDGERCTKCLLDCDLALADADAVGLAKAIIATVNAFRPARPANRRQRRSWGKGRVGRC